MPVSIGTAPYSFNFKLLQVKVNNFTISPSTSITINSNNSITLELLIPTFQIVFNFTMDGLSNWVIASSHGHLYLNNFGFKIVSTLLSNSGNMSLSLEYVELFLTNNTIDFFIEGTNDWIKVINLTADAALPYIVKEIGGAIAPSFVAQIQNLINGLLTSSPTLIEMPVNLIINYGITNSLTTADNALQIGMNGTIFTNNVVIPVHYPTDTIVMPKIVPGAGDLQFIVSEYMVLCSLYAIYSQNIMHAEVSNVTIGNSTLFVDNKFIGIFIPEAITLFPGQTGKVTISVNALPVFTIDTQAITIQVNANSNIYLGSTIVTDVALTIAFQISFAVKNGMLMSNIVGYTFSLTEIKSDARINLNIASLNQLFNTVLKFALPQIDDFLSVGITLPSMLGLTFKNSTIIQGSHYLVIGTSPVSSTHTIKLIQQGINMIEYGDMVDELKKVLMREAGKMLLFGI